MFAVRKQLVRNNMRRFASSSSLSVTHNGFVPSLKSLFYTYLPLFS